MPSLNPYLMLAEQQERREALVREAATARLLAQAKRQQPVLWQCCLAHLGEWLIVCGNWLKQRSTPVGVTRLSSN